ncbi:MAG TPA: redoxin domain-containing protein [Gemmata sp.]
MKRAGAGLIVAALLALAGCKSLDTKAPDKTAGLGWSKGDTKNGKDTKGALAKGQTWLDGAGPPKGVSPTNPKDPFLDAKTAALNTLGGRVLDMYGRPARNVEVRIEELSATTDSGAPIYIESNNEGYFSANGLKSGRSYELSVSVKAQDGKTYSGAVQTKVPNVTLLISLRDDLPPRAGGGFPAPNPIDPGAAGPATARPKPPGDAWSPSGPTNGAPPATIGSGSPAPSPVTSGGLPTGPIPQPDDLVPSPAPRPVKPENVADDPKSPFRPPVTTIPNPNGPPVPPLPKPPVFAPSGSGARPVGGNTVGKFTLLDTLERPWESDSMRPGELVLVEFATSSCVHCPRAVPVLKDLQSRYGANGLQVKGVLCDDLPQKARADVAARYQQTQHLNYALYVEPVEAGTVRDQLGVKAYPHAILLDSGGRVLWRGNPLDSAKLEAAVKQGVGK